MVASLPPTRNCCTPAIPTRWNESRSETMPSFVTQPFIHCQKTRGRASGGGERKPRTSGSSAADARGKGAASATSASKARLAQETRAELLPARKRCGGSAACCT